MGFEEVFNNVIQILENYDCNKIRNLDDMIALHNDKMSLMHLNSVYSDYYSICNSPEFNRIKSKYCVTI